MVGGATVERLDVQRHQGAGLGTYLAEYLEFFGRVLVALVRSHRRHAYAAVQVATLPDWLVFAGLPLRLAGVPLVLDLHEAMPEFFRSRFPGAANPVVHGALLAAERLSIAAATRAITVNEALRGRLAELGVPAAKVTVIGNSPSLARFDPERAPARAFRADGSLRLVYAGALTPTYELDVAFRAMAALDAQRPELGVSLDVYGRGDSAAELEALARGLGLAERVVFHGRIPVDDVPAAIARADIGLAPTRRDAFTEMSLSTKIFEYAAMAKPVVCSRLPMVEATLGVGRVWTYTPGEAAEMLAAIIAIVDDEAERAARVAAASARTRELAWEIEGPRYVRLVESLAGPARA